MISPGLSSTWAMARGFRKMPVPMTVPTTIEVASTSPSARSKPGASAVSTLIGPRIIGTTPGALTCAMPVGFAREHATMRCDGASLEEIAGAHGTPLYVYSRPALEADYGAYDRAFAGVTHRICYALKANSAGALLRILVALGAGADVVSGFELLAALRAGFEPEDIVFSGAGKSDLELALGIDQGIGSFNAESEEEIRRISRAADARGRTVRVGLRVNPDIDARSHPYISTGLRENKFGVDIAEAPEILRRARALPGISVVGVQCHIGSQINELDPLEQAVREVVGLSRRLLADGFALETVDLGGGLGVDYEGGRPLDPARLAEVILPALEGLPLTLFLEPGRSLLAPAGTLLTRVLYLKENRGRRFVIVDAGMNDLLRPSLYEAFHRIEP